MSISKFLPGLAKATDEAIVSLEETKAFNRAHAPKNGPQKVRWVTAGQQRRAVRRAQAAERRKGNRAYRRDWITAQHAGSNLAGQIWVIDHMPTWHPVYRNAFCGIVKTFGKFNDNGDLVGNPIGTAREALEAGKL